jgi:23S rRNA pseudouridine1911/1915/1917 synthase
VTLETGRTHQIRVHLKAIGLPVSGDPEYGRSGGGASGPAGAHPLGLERQFLHAARLSLDHPITGERLVVESPLPADLAEALRRARDGS